MYATTNFVMDDTLTYVHEMQLYVRTYVHGMLQLNAKDSLLPKTCVYVHTSKALLYMMTSHALSDETVKHLLSCTRGSFLFPCLSCVAQLMQS